MLSSMNNFRRMTTHYQNACIGLLLINFLAISGNPQINKIRDKLDKEFLKYYPDAKLEVLSVLAGTSTTTRMKICLKCFKDEGYPDIFKSAYNLLKYRLAFGTGSKYHEWRIVEMIKCHKRNTYLRESLKRGYFYKILYDETEKCLRFSHELCHVQISDSDFPLWQEQSSDTREHDLEYSTAPYTISVELYSNPRTCKDQSHYENEFLKHYPDEKRDVYSILFGNATQPGFEKYRFTIMKICMSCFKNQESRKKFQIADYSLVKYGVAFGPTGKAEWRMVQMIKCHDKDAYLRESVRRNYFYIITYNEKEQCLRFSCELCYFKLPHSEFPSWQTKVQDTDEGVVRKNRTTSNNHNVEHYKMQKKIEHEFLYYYPDANREVTSVLFKGATTTKELEAHLRLSIIKICSKCFKGENFKIGGFRTSDYTLVKYGVAFHHTSNPEWRQIEMIKCGKNMYLREYLRRDYFYIIMYNEAENLLRLDSELCHFKLRDSDFPAWQTTLVNTN